VRSGLQSLMPGASYVAVTSLSEILAPELRAFQLGATMFTIFGVLALVLAAVGLYSVIAYNVAQRTHEMGVRRALGAQTGDVVRLILTDGLALGTLGVVIGVAVAFWGVRFIGPLLFGVPARDPMIFGLVAASLLAVAAAASWIPALRASRVDPNVALRAE
jgi:putative ABC transport system permease protein